MFLNTILSLTFLLLSGPAFATDSHSLVDCTNPQAAADSIFIWQANDNYDPSNAQACFQVPENMVGERLAVQLKQILDARGLFIPIASMSTDPNYQEEDLHRVVPLPEFPVLALVRDDQGQWKYSEDTLKQVPDLYADTFSPLSVWFQSKLPSTFYERALGLYLWQYLYGFLLIGVAWLIGTIVRLFLRTQFRRIVQKMKLHINEATYSKTNMPIVVMAMSTVLLWGIPDLQLGILVSVALYKMAWLTLGLAGLLFAYRLIDVVTGIANKWADGTESKLDDQLIPLLRQAARMVLFVIGAIFIATMLGFNPWQLTAGVGIGGLAFALAAQDTVANLFGSLNIFIDKPFQIGDAVAIGGVEGVVEEVGFRSTRIRTYHNSLVTIPNNTITNANVDNMGNRPRRRVKMVLGLTYDTAPDKIQAFVEGVRGILASHPSVEQTYEVHLYNLGDSAIEILVHYHLVVPGWAGELEGRSQNILEFLRLAEALGVSFAFPSTSLYVESTPTHPVPTTTCPPVGDLEQIADSFGPGGTLARPGGPNFQSRFTVQNLAKTTTSDD